MLRGIGVKNLLLLFTNKYPIADVNIYVRKSKLRDNKKRSIVIIVVNDNTFYLTKELNIKQIKQKPLDVLAYLLTRERFLSLENKKQICINNQYFCIDSLNLVALKESGKKLYREDPPSKKVN